MLGRGDGESSEVFLFPLQLENDRSELDRIGACSENNGYLLQTIVQIFGSSESSNAP
jgi:hypothetical protein